MSGGAVALWEKRMFVEREGYVCWGRGNALLGGMSCRVERECPVGRRGNVLSGGGNAPFGGKGISVAGKGMSCREEGNLRLENRYPPYLRWKGIWEG